MTTDDPAHSWPARVGVVLATAVGSTVAAVIPTVVVGGVLMEVAERRYAARSGGVEPDGIGFVVPALALGVLFTGLILLALTVRSARRLPAEVRELDARIHLGAVALVWALPLVLLLLALVRPSGEGFPPGFVGVLVPPVLSVIGVLASRVTATVLAAVLLGCGPAWTATEVVQLEFGGGIAGVPFAWATTFLAGCALWLLVEGRPVSPV